MEFTGERFIPEKLKKTDETYKEHFERYRFAYNYVKGAKVLDAACGVGYGTFMLSRKAEHVCGIDISEESIQYAGEKYFNSNIEFEVGDVNEIKYPNNFFDVVVSFETIEHITSQDIFLKEIKRVIKPNGLLIISTPNKETVPKGKEVHTPFHTKEFTLSEMMELLKSFKDREVYSQKMTYYRRLYKKLRLLFKHANSNIVNRMVSYAQKKYTVIQNAPILYKILLYEYVYKFRVIPYREKNIYIKPTFFIVVCKA